MRTLVLSVLFPMVVALTGNSASSYGGRHEDVKPNPIAGRSKGTEVETQDKGLSEKDPKILKWGMHPCVQMTHLRS